MLKLKILKVRGTMAVSTQFDFDFDFLSFFFFWCQLNIVPSANAFREGRLMSVGGTGLLPRLSSESFSLLS